ncbi:MAG TPA: hypothetical protein VFX51_24700 [Solirubrobacteraceae bacterium]|nr:hypothetical protein [Solirubrobacteraceae bacterium]
MPQQQAWGGDLHMPHWMRRVLHRPDPPADSAERVHEARKPQDTPTVAENVDRAMVGSLSELYVEGQAARKKASPRGDKR